jgi:ABC-type Na+ efflux pump permease subunit
MAKTKCHACGIIDGCNCLAGQGLCRDPSKCSLYKQSLTISPYQSTIASLKKQIAALGKAPPPPPPFQLVQNIQCQVCTAVVDLSGIRADAQSTVDIGKIDNAINCMQNQRTAAVAEQQRQEAAAAERERQAKLEAERLAAEGRAREAELAAQRAAAAEAERLRLQQEAAAAAERTRLAQQQRITDAQAERTALDQQSSAKNNTLIFLIILLFVVFSLIVGLSVYYVMSPAEPAATTV